MLRPALLFALILAAPLVVAETASTATPTPNANETATIETVVTPDGQSFFSPKTEGDIAAMANLNDSQDLTSDLGED